MSPPPITSQDIPDSWLATLRQIASRHEGTVLRKHPTLPRIQSWSVNYNIYVDQMLYSSAMEFVSVEERDLAWQRLWKL